MTRFPVLVADPPWPFRTYSDKGKARSPERHYPTLSREDLLQLKVGALAARPAALFLWATPPLLDFAIRCGEQWGFSFKSVAFTWAKRTATERAWFTGMGYYTRANAEFCLLFTAGVPRRKARDVQSLVVAPVGRHSAKPEAVQDRIEQLFDGPYCELFARRQRPGWTCIGNEIDGRDIREVLNAGHG
jgi:N6-adenosine-specific RNA methylase IME4